MKTFDDLPIEIQNRMWDNRVRIERLEERIEKTLP